MTIRRCYSPCIDVDRHRNLFQFLDYIYPKLLQFYFIINQLIRQPKVAVHGSATRSMQLGYKSENYE